MLVDFGAGRCRLFASCAAGSRVFYVGIDIARISKAVATDVEALRVLGDEVFWIQGLKPRMEDEIP